MKEINQDPIYDGFETHDEARPIELYKMWNDTTSRYFNSSDVTVTISGIDYIPTEIKRDSIEFDSDLNANKVNVTAGALTDPVINYIASNPVETYWITINRLHRDHPDQFQQPIFYGFINNISYKGVVAQVTCVDITYLLDRKVPRERYQVNCNNILFDDLCGLSSGSYRKVTTVASVSDNGLVITLNGALVGTDLYKYGWAESGEHKTQVISNTLYTVSVRVPITGLATSDAITVYYGCDKTHSTCTSKFSNQANFFGFPYIPARNPALRI